MIKISKSVHPPVVKFTYGGHKYKGFIKWRIAEKMTLRDFLTKNASFLDGTYQFVYDYGKELFREELQKCQGFKCCFCEKPVANGQVEHFRPKNGWQQARGAGNALTKPGYYWLAYRWENMLISCSECNQNGQKGNLFPINGVRATTPTCSLNLENKVIIDPSEEDPAEYISFNKEIPVGIDNAGRGDANISIFKLKTRADLSGRSDRFRLYETTKMIADIKIPFNHITQKKIDDAKQFVNIAKAAREPFSGMIRENIKKGLI